MRCLNVILAVAGLSATLPVLAQAQATCKGDYEMVHAECKSTGEVIGSKRISLKHEMVNAGACEVKDSMALCREKIPALLKLYPDARPEDVRPSNPHYEGVAEMCGNAFKGTFRQKRNVFCDFEITYNVHQKKADESCPIIDVVEKSKCFESSPIVIDRVALSQCLNLNPKTPQEWWLKSACVSDYFAASQNFNVEGMSSEDGAKAERQLDLLIRKTSTPGWELLNNYVSVRKSQANSR